MTQPDDDSDVDYTFAVEAPPPPGSELRRNIAQAAEHPGEWCRIATYKKKGSADTLASNLRTGRRGGERPEGHWEFVSKERDDGSWGIWARFTPNTRRTRRS